MREMQCVGKAVCGKCCLREMPGTEIAFVGQNGSRSSILHILLIVPKLAYWGRLGRVIGSSEWLDFEKSLSIDYVPTNVSALLKVAFSLDIEIMKYERKGQELLLPLCHAWVSGMNLCRRVIVLP